MIISTTKFRLRKLSLYGRFFLETYRVVKQVRRAGGIVKMRIKPFSLRTITIWKTEADMLSFRNSGAHLEAMKRSTSFGDISSVSWESGTICSWKEAMERLRNSAEVSHCDETG